MRILNGRTKGDSLGRATFHGSNGISVVDYIICDQELFQKVEHFIVKPPTYLSDHSQIITWIDIKKYIAEPNVEPCNIQMTKLPKQFIWDKQSKNNFRQTLKTPEIQQKINNFINSDFTNDTHGINDCVSQFQNILLETSKKSLKIKKIKNQRRKINNVAQKKWFDKECRIKRHQLRKLANLKHKDPTNITVRNSYHDALKSYKTTLQIKQNEFQNNIIKNLEETSQTDSNLFWKTLQNSNDNIDTESNSENSPKENEWFSHFEQLHCEYKLSNEQKTIIEKLKKYEIQKNYFNELDTEITIEEIMKAAKNIKNKKAAHTDKINNEMLKHSVDILANGFIKLFNTIMNTGICRTHGAKALSHQSLNLVIN